MGQLEIVAFATAALVAGHPSTALGDWAYTHWGMSPDQVAAASDGSVNVMPADKQTRDDVDHWVTAVEGSYDDGAAHGEVGFMFDTRTNGLKCVAYNTSGPGVAILRATLLKRFGKPSSSGSYGPVEMMSWDKPDKTDFAANQGPVAAVTQCAPANH
jgi:hypothetical protein